MYLLWGVIHENIKVAVKPAFKAAKTQVQTDMCGVEHAASSSSAAAGPVCTSTHWIENAASCTAAGPVVVPDVGSVATSSSTAAGPVGSVWTN